jgi:hypothetical protein
MYIQIFRHRYIYIQIFIHIYIYIQGEGEEGGPRSNKKNSIQGFAPNVKDPGGGGGGKKKEVGGGGKKTKGGG